MILRSVTKHVTDQNWFAVFLDLLIVVFGVFIGIQVSNWNEERTAEKQNKVMIERLYDDLKNDQIALTSLMDYQAVVRKYALNAVDALNGDESVTDEQLVVSAYQASQISAPWNYRSTYDEMLSTGQVNLVKSESLKDLILGYYSVDWARQDSLTGTAPFRKLIRGILSIPIQDAIKSTCGDVRIMVANTFGSLLPPSCDLQLPDELFQTTAQLIRSQPGLLFELQYQIALYDTQVSTMSGFEQETHKLMAAIKEHQP